MRSRSKIDSYTLDWLLAACDDATEVVDEGFALSRLRYVLPPGTGEAWVESLALRDGIVLFRAVHALSPSPPGQLVSIMEAHALPDGPVFNAQIWLSGIACHREYWHGREQPPVEIISGPGRDTFRLHREWQAEILVEGGITSEMRSLVIPDTMFRSLLGDSIAEQLVAALDLGRARPTTVRPMPLHVSASLRDAMSAQYSGDVRRLYAQARVLDYLASLYCHVARDQAARKEGSHLKQIQDLHHHLIHLEGRMPTLNELAHQFGLSARRMNEEFSEEYGMSIFNFVTDHRLKLAHAAMVTGGTPMKVLAARLGYSHVNHFIAAFKRKFGYSPGSLRKR
jgi:AraC-like DNA-binding protein